LVNPGRGKKFPDYLTGVTSILKMNIEKVTIKKIVHGGFGLCRLPSGKILFIQGGLPGETVDVKVDIIKKNHLFGRITKFIKPHNARRVAPCIYYNQCGGCNLLHCDTPTQLTIKEEILHDLLHRSSEPGVSGTVDLLLPPIPSPTSFGYRQRIRLQVDKQGRLGFRQFRSHDIIPIHSCMLAEKSINKCLKELRYVTDFHKLASLATEVELQLNPYSQAVVCLIHLVRKPRPADITAARSICNNIKSIEQIFFVGEDFPIMGLYGKEELQKRRHLFICYDKIGSDSSPLRLQWEAGGFCQVNLRQNRQLINIVLELGKVTKGETVLDLFCGMGNFSVPLGRMAKSVTGIEGQGSSIRSARTNGQNDGLTNVTFIKSSILDGCKKLQRHKTVFDCIVIDPPRQGIPGLAPYLEKLTKKKLIYISCDPATLCRDLADLTRTGFRLKKIQPLDMFPQTHHIETVILLEKE
jgi:23S rRNA (uracil1939-C5)-methyltransferase